MTARHYSNSQNLVISFEYGWFLAKNLSNFVSLPWKLHNRKCHNEQHTDSASFLKSHLNFCSSIISRVYFFSNSREIMDAKKILYNFRNFLIPLWVTIWFEVLQSGTKWSRSFAVVGKRKKKEVPLKTGVLSCTPRYVQLKSIGMTMSNKT